ncbi:hypothetical protein V6N13_081880 [Hibiscus sabdariffa]
MARGGIITLYVGNLPEKLHWCGLRQAFRRHGDLVDAYIAKKLDRQGKLFGFVRYSKMWDARRAMESLNGFKIFGFRLVVFLARYNARTSYWKKQKVVPQSLNQSRAEGIEERNVAIESHMLEEAGKVAVNGNNRGCKKISGFVDNETLWMLGKCLVGTMAKDYSTKEVEERLHQWGLGDTLVKRLGGRDYLLKLVDEELLQVLEKQELSLLEEIFIKVEYWSETYRAQERSTWIEVRGIALHCWNSNTFSRVAGLWGHLIALGEDVNQFVDGERMNILISAKQLNRIEESIVLEVGKENFSIFASEIHSVRLIHKGAGDDSKKEPVRSESIDSSSSSASTTPSKKLKSQNLNLNGEEILRLTKLLEKGELDLANFIKDLKGNNSRSTSQKLEKISNLAIAPKKYLCINGNEDLQNSHMPRALFQEVQAGWKWWERPWI